MSADIHRLAVITGSVRAGRIGPAVARWFVRHAERRPDTVTDAIDLASMTLPDDLSGGGDVPAFAERIGAADAIVIVTPEYNHGYPGALKTAIDSLTDEWRAKPIGFVSYGGTAGGQRAVEQLRPVFAELHAVTLRDTVSFPSVHRRFDPDGRLRGPEHAEAAADVLLDQIAWWSRVLRTGRNDGRDVA